VYNKYSDFMNTLNEELVRKISDLKNEPEWMLDFRLESLKSFYALDNPNFGPNIDLDFSKINYYKKISDTKENWEDVDKNIKNTFDVKPVILAPDKGAINFAKEIAVILDTDYDYLEKVRLSPEVVETKTKNISVKDKNVVIIDDIISTGGTIVNAINILKEQGAVAVDVFCVHPVLVNDAVLKINAAGAHSVQGTNTLKSDVSFISVAKTIANHLKSI